MTSDLGCEEQFLHLALDPEPSVKTAFLRVSPGGRLHLDSGETPGRNAPMRPRAHGSMSESGWMSGALSWQRHLSRCTTPHLFGKPGGTTECRSGRQTRDQVIGQQQFDKAHHRDRLPAPATVRAEAPRDAGERDRRTPSAQAPGG